MDASAFEADVEDDLSVTDLYDKLPEDAKRTIGVIILFARSLAKLGLIVAAFAYCAWAFALLIGWICLFWVQTQLLLKLSALLRVCYEVSKDPGNDGDGAHPTERFPKPGKACTDAINGEGQYENNTLPPSHTSDEFDMFEAFLNSPRDSREHSTPLQEPKGSNEPSHQHNSSYDIPDGAILKTKEDFQATISEGEHEKDQGSVHQKGQITLSDEPIDYFDEEIDETTRAKLAGLSRQDQEPLLNDDTPAANAIVKGVSMKEASSRLDKGARAIAKQLEETQRRAAEQTAWLEGLKAGTLDSRKAKSPQGPLNRSSAGHASESMAAATTLSTTGAGTAHFTPEQLEEAASFAAEATRGQSKTTKARAHTTQASQLTSQKRSIRKPGAIGTAALQQNQSNQHPNGQSHRPIQAWTHKAAAKDVKSATLKSGAVPPHLRKKLAEQDAQQSGEQASEEDSRNVQDSAQMTTASPVPTLDVDKTSHQVKDVESETFQSQQLSKEDQLEPIEHGGNDGDILGEDGFSLTHPNNDKPFSPLQQSHDHYLEVSYASLPERLSIDDLMRMDQRECIQKLAGVVGSGNERTAVRDRMYEPTPPITKPAERSMSIERLKTFNTGPAPPGDARIARAQTMISGFELGSLAEQADPGKSVDKIEHPLNNLDVPSSNVCSADEEVYEDKVRPNGSHVKTEQVDHDNGRSHPHSEPSLGLSTVSLPIPSVIVVPNTPTDEEAQPSATIPIPATHTLREPNISNNWGPPGSARPIVMQEAWQACFNGPFKRTPIQPETPLPCPSNPPGEAFRHHQDDQLAQSRIIFEDDSGASEDEISRGEVQAAQAPAALNQQKARSSSRSPERKAALDQAVDVLDTQAHKKRASLSLRTLHGSLDATPKPADPTKKEINESLHTTTGTGSGYQHSDLLNLDFDTSEGVSPSLPVPRPKPSPSLSAKAPAFFAPSQKTADQDNSAAKQGKEQLPTSFVESSGEMFSHPQSVTEYMTPSYPFWNASFANPYASATPTYNAYSQQYMADQYWREYSGVGYAQYPPQYALQTNHGVSFGGAPGLNQTAVAVANTQVLNSAPTSSLPIALPIKYLTSNAMPIKAPAEAHTDLKVPYDQALPPLSGATNSPTDTQRSAAPGLKKADGVSQKTFDRLLYDYGHAVDTRSAGLIWSKDNVNELLDVGRLRSETNFVRSLEARASTSDELKVFAKDFKLPPLSEDQEARAPKAIAGTYTTSSQSDERQMGIKTGLQQRSQPTSAMLLLSRDASVDQRFQFNPSSHPGAGISNNTELSSGKLREVTSNIQLTAPAYANVVDAKEMVEAERENEEVYGESPGKQADLTSTEQESTANAKKRRRKAREALRHAWRERENVRRRVLSTWTLDGARSLEYATETYNGKRSDLAKTMVSNVLSEEDAKEFPVLSKTDLSAPRVRPAGLQSASKVQKAVDSSVLTKRSSEPENRAPALMTDAMLEELAKTAMEARKSYEDAHAYFQRPPPQGRAKLRDLRKQGEARIELAAKRYRKKIEVVEAAYPNGLPVWLARELWSYDDEAIKKSRDEWMLY